MPPKAKKPDGNRNQGPVEDETGIPKNEVAFKFAFEVKQNEVADILIMFEWINSSDSTAREKLDTELIECWNQKAPEDPTVVNFELETSVFRVEDKFVKNLCANKFYIHFVSVEDQTVKDTIQLHYSPLLTAKGLPKFEFYHDKVKIPQIEYFRLTLTADRELLTPLYKDYLNPLEICIVGGKEMPNPNPGYDKYEPVYVQAKFFDGTIIKTHEVAHAATCKWMYKQVILAGFIDPLKLKEDLKSIPLTFEIHDQDEVAKNTIREFKQLIDVKYEEPEPPAEVLDPKAKGGKGAAAVKKGKEPEKKEEKPKDTKAKDAKDAKGKKDLKKKKDVKTFEPVVPKETREFIRANYGLSNFNLNDLLNPHVTSIKLRNYIVPLQKFESKDAKNLDLNTTARRELQERHVAGDYMSNESYLVVTFEIAHAIRPFKKPAQPAQDTLNIQQQELRPKSKGDTKAAPPAKVDPKKKGAAQPETEAPKIVEVVDEKPVYERAVYVFPYKSQELTPKLLSIVENINMDAFGLKDKNPLFITTKALNEEEKKSRTLDIITGLEFIDNEYRTFILEGLSDKGMKRLEEEFPKLQPNSREVKILKNPDIKFKSRLYTDFNIDVKKIRLRENLSRLLTKADIYLRSKVPEHIYQVLITFNELRRCENLKAAIASNLFPDINNLIAMERKYGDALTDEDVSGREGQPQKIVKRTAAKMSKIGSDLGISVLNSATSNPGIDSKSKRLAEITQSDDKLPEINDMAPRSTSHRLATKVERIKHDKYSLHMTQPYPTEGEVFTQAGAKLNVYEKQKAELREIARNDPNHFYTYSADYLSLSIDPYTPDEIKKIDDEFSKKLWKTKEGFQTVLKKDKKDYITHPKKPHSSKVDELTSHPWHQSKLAESKQLMNTRGEPIRNGPDFMGQVQSNNFFSTPEIYEEEKITNVEKERRIREAKKKAEEEWKAKMKVDNAYFYTSLCVTRNSQLDKIKGIREGDAVKKGLVLGDSRLRKTSLGTTKSINENPISLYLSEEWSGDGKKNLFERHMDARRAVSPYDFKTNIKQQSQYGMVYKPMKEIFQ